MTAASRSHTSRLGRRAPAGSTQAPARSGAACSGRYPLRWRSSMARATAFGVAPTPSSLGRAGPHGRPARSMWSVQGSAPGRIGVGRGASMCRSIDVLILYDNTSTVVRCQSPGAMAKTSTVPVATDAWAVRGPATCSSPAQAVRAAFWGRPRPGRAYAHAEKAAGYRSLSRPGGCQLSGETTPRRESKRSPGLRPRGHAEGSVRTPGPWKHTERCSSGDRGSMSHRTLARDTPPYGRQDMLRVPAWGLPGEPPLDTHGRVVDQRVRSR
jgi:hypothetical protein